MKKNIKEIKINNRLRALNNSKVENLSKSIKEVGLLQPITIDRENNLVAGLHRLEACRLLGKMEIECNVLTFENDLLKQLAEIDENLIRNDLTVLEQADWLQKRKEIYEQLYPETKQGMRNGQTSKSADSAFLEKPSFVENTSNQTGKKKRAIETNIQIAKKIVPEVKEKIYGTELANQKTNLLEIAKLEPEKQKEVIEKITPENTVKEVLSEIKKEKRAELIEQQKREIENGNINEVNGLYDVIAIDPPWNYGSKYDPNGFRGSCPYPEMKQDELINLKIPAKENSIIFLWTTDKFIWDAKELMDLWGFTYRNILVWNKVKMGIGKLLRLQCEFCLVGVKGSPIINSHSCRDIIEEPRREHSRKPEKFYKLVDDLCVGKKLDMFARESHIGWDIWGVENQNFKK